MSGQICVSILSTEHLFVHYIFKNLTDEYQLKPDLPRCGGFLQFKGLSGGLPRWRAAYDEAWNRTLSQSEKQKQKVHRMIQLITSCTWGKESIGSGGWTNFEVPLRLCTFCGPKHWLLSRSQERVYAWDTWWHLFVKNWSNLLTYP